MRKITFLLLLAIALAWASSAHAALSFKVDFGQNGTYETSWPMKAGDVVAVDIYVSNVPSPGLISMGFKLTYDPAKLSVDSAGVDDNWLLGEIVDVSNSGEIEMAGFRLVGLPGNNIRLGTVRFRCLSEGNSTLMLVTRGGGYKGFVLDCIGESCNPDDPYLILDGDIGAGVLLARVEEDFPWVLFYPAFTKKKNR